MCVVLAPLSVRLYMDTSMCLAEVPRKCAIITIAGTKPQVSSYTRIPCLSRDTLVKIQ